MYYLGQGVPTDYKKAYAWFVADSDTKISLFMRAYMEEHGLGVEKNPGDAFRNYGRAAYRGSEEAKAVLGEYYYLGKDGTKKDLQLAKLNFNEAAEKDDPIAKLYLADMFASGEGVERDLAKAKLLLAEGETLVAQQRKRAAEGKLMSKVLAPQSESLLKQVKGRIASIPINQPASAQAEDAPKAQSKAATPNPKPVNAEPQPRSNTKADSQ